MFNKKETDPREALANVPTDTRLLYINALALRSIISELEKNFIMQAATLLSGGNNVFNVESAKGPMLMLCHQDASSELAGAKAMLSVLEGSDELKRACAIMEPVLEAVAKVEAEEEKLLRERLQNKAALHEAEEAAKKRALANVEKDPAVLAAKQKLQESVA
jgi:hypothetical protein